MKAGDVRKSKNNTYGVCLLLDYDTELEAWRCLILESDKSIHFELIYEQLGSISHYSQAWLIKYTEKLS